MKFCTTCGTKLMPGGKFCTGCGARIATPETTPAPTEILGAAAAAPLASDGVTTPAPSADTTSDALTDRPGVETPTPHLPGEAFEPHRSTDAPTTAHPADGPSAPIASTDMPPSSATPHPAGEASAPVVPGDTSAVPPTTHSAPGEASIPVTWTDAPAAASTPLPSAEAVAAPTEATAFTAATPYPPQRTTPPPVGTPEYTAAPTASTPGTTPPPPRMPSGADVRAGATAAMGSLNSTLAPAAGRAMPHLRFGALQQPQLVAAATAAAIATGIVLAAFLLLTTLIVTTSGLPSVPPADIFRMSGIATAMSLGASLIVTPPVGYVAVRLTPLLGTLLFVVAVALLTRRRAATARPEGTFLPECLVTGAVAGLLVAILSLLTTGPVPVDELRLTGVATIGASPWSGLLGGFVLGTVGAMLGAGRHQTQGAALSRWRFALLTTRELVALTLLVGIVVTIVSSMAGASPTTAASRSDLGDVPGVGRTLERVTDAAANSSDSDGGSGLGVIGLGLAYLPNLLMLAGGFGQGGSVGFNAAVNAQANALSKDAVNLTPSVGAGLLAGHIPCSVSLTILTLMALVAALVGVRAALRTAPGQKATTLAWSSILAVCLVWLLFVTLTTLRLDGTMAMDGLGSGAVHGTIGLSLASTLIMAAFWAAVAALLGPILARTLGAIKPAAVAGLAGRHLDPDWRVLLTDAALRRSLPVPARSDDVAEGLRTGRIAPPAQPLDHRHRKALLGAAGALGLLLTLGIAHAVLSATVFSPKATVAAYLDAVRDKDGERAQSLVAHDPTEDDSVAAAFGTLPDAELTDEGESGRDESTVHSVSARFATEDGDDENGPETMFRLIPGAKRFGLFRTWLVTNPYGTLSTSAAGGVAPDSITLDGVTVGQGTHSVYPGVHTVAAPGSSLMAAATPRTASVLGGSSPDVQVSADVAPDAAAKAEAALKAHLVQCAKSTDASPTGCPFSRFAWGDERTTWRITRYPQIKVSPSYDGTGLGLEVVTPGEASWAGADSTGTSDIYPRGHIESNGSTVTYIP